MDFAAIMAAAMSKSISNPAPAASESKPKYLKRSELEAQREATYLADQAALARSRDEKAAHKRKHEDDEAERRIARDEKRRRLAEDSRARREEEETVQEAGRRKRLGLPPLPAKGDQEEEVKKDEDIEEVALVEKLRILKEPAVLFAESHVQRLRRFRRLTAVKPVMTTGPIPTTLVLLSEAEMHVPAKMPPPGEEREYVFRQLASYFTLVLTEWRRSLDERPLAVKESSQGRQAEAAMEQSRENMRPLFRMFESGELKEEMLQPVMEIVRTAQGRRYVDANNKYLELSIGKAAWPIGVVSVGIHARASRSRIGEERGNVAHIMGDEIARRWLQAIKRCLTFAQTRWPPDDQMQLMG